MGQDYSADKTQPAALRNINLALVLSPFLSFVLSFSPLLLCSPCFFFPPSLSFALLYSL